MKIKGRRVHLAGSADAATPDPLLRYAHDVIDKLVRTFAAAGATFLVGVGKEPPARLDDSTSPSIIFDWTALAAAHECLCSGDVAADGPQGRLIAALVTEKTDRQIPTGRRDLWRGLRHAGAVKLEYTEPGWVSGAVRRIRQAQLGDILIGLSGGEGVEHLAQLYVAAGKPVIPLDLAIGSSMHDGSGGAARLARAARAHPTRFVHLADPDAAADLLARTATQQGQAEVSEVVAAVMDLILALEPPSAFYVRLLNDAEPDYEAVERFFRRVVDPTVARLGYRTIEMGRGVNNFAWLNEAIFDRLHYSSVAVVDLRASQTITSPKRRVRGRRCPRTTSRAPAVA
ncbi:MAG TPA: hypothetical protein VLA19_26855 [Herpetosiphonaceae bacterium]|nr:hypothetical protein [Herpetosiphonaceae bacterium]